MQMSYCSNQWWEICKQRFPLIINSFPLLTHTERPQKQIEFNPSPKAVMAKTNTEESLISLFTFSCFQKA